MKTLINQAKGKNNLLLFEFDKSVLAWWNKGSAAAKISFLSAIVVGFLSHLFVYTGRYYGRDDMNRITRPIGPVRTGRWFNGVITFLLADNYVLPLVYGMLVAVFLATAAFYVCKIFSVSKKMNGVLIGMLLSTFPSIANTNLFLYETATYHFSVLLAVLAVYLAIRYKYGFLVGSVLAMLTLAT